MRNTCSLSVSIKESKQHRKRVRELRGNDLAYIIDTLIYRLGLSLRTAAEQLEEIGPSEEEQIGREEEIPPTLDEIPKFDLIKAIQRKIRTLVNRMLKNLERTDKSKEPTHRPAEKLLAVLAVMREVRAQDRRFLQLTESQSLVPLEYRKKLLDGSIAALFGRKQRLFDSFVTALGKDPEEDVSRLLGLLLWLSYDCGMDARELNTFPVGNPEERRERLLNLAKLFEIAVASGKDKKYSRKQNTVFGEPPQNQLRCVLPTGLNIINIGLRP